MSLVNYTSKEINIKIVYYGPGLSGKTTNLQCIHQKLNPKQRGKLLSLATEADRTLFFDFLPISLGDIKGFSTRFHVYTVPGQVHYNETRKMVLKGVDGIVFVADSQLQMMEDNLESLRNLYKNLKDMGKTLEDIPFVLQYNKRDLENVVAIQDMDRSLNNLAVPSHDAVALSGKGVLETFTEISKLSLKKVREKPTLLNEERADENELLTKFMQGEGIEEVDRLKEAQESVETPENLVAAPEGLLAPHEKMETPSEKESDENQEQPQMSETLQPMTKEEDVDSTADTHGESFSEEESVRSPEEMLTPAESLAEEDAAERSGFMETLEESDLSEPSIPEESGEDIAILADVMKMADEEPLEEIHDEDELSPEEAEEPEDQGVISDETAYKIIEGEPLFDPKEIMEKGEEGVYGLEKEALDETEAVEKETTISEEAPCLDTVVAEERSEETFEEIPLETETELSLETSEGGEEEPAINDDLTHDISEEEPLFEVIEMTEEGDGAVEDIRNDETFGLETEAHQETGEEAAEETPVETESEQEGYIEERADGKSVQPPFNMSLDPSDINNVTLGSPECKGGGKFIIPLIINSESGSEELKLNLQLNAEEASTDKIKVSLVTGQGTETPGIEKDESADNDFSEGSNLEGTSESMNAISEEINFDENIDSSFLDELDELDDAPIDELPHGEEEKKEKKGFFISLFGGKHTAKH